VPTIKKYPNRKLYDMDSKQYITLEGIADLIRQDREIRVIDHVTGEDLPSYAARFSLERYDDPAYREILDAWGATGQL